MFLPFANAHVYNALDLVRILISHGSLSLPDAPSQTKSPTQSQASSAETLPIEETTPIKEYKPPPLYALIIGINEYQSEEFENLDGAVADAQAFKNYLETSLGVPPSQISTLFNKKATRDAIIASLRALKSDPRINSGDPIVIFYAGHGSTADAPSGWNAGGPEIQLLVSHDTLCDEDGNISVGLPDRTIGVLLGDIAQEKGDNITVVFDCCHSGSLTRDAAHPTRHVRGVKMPDKVKVPADLDRDIWGGPKDRGTAIAPGFLKSGLRSHVLLSACGAEENAKEELGRGYFTKRLLDTLEAVGADKVTYADLVQRIPCLPWQNPQCEGHHQDRICFNSKAPVLSNRVYPVRKVGQRHVMDAGTAHGITEGAVFALHNDRNFAPTQGPAATLVASRPNAFSTVLVETPEGSHSIVNDRAFALLIRVGNQEDLRVYVELDEDLMKVFEALAIEMQIEDPAKPKIMLVEKDTAHFYVASEDHHVIFNILDPLVTMHGLKRMPFRVSPTVEDIRPVFRKAAHFFWHLRRTGNAKVLQSKVNIEFNRLEEIEEEYDDDLNPVRKPCGPNLIREGVVDIVIDDEAMYGIKITNEMERPLYASLFYFDNSDLSITPYFQPPTSSGKVDPPLRSKGDITIGYGAGGGPPFKYSLWDGQDVDVGFLKLFLSTEQVDLSCIPQHSPFERGSRGVKPFKPKALGLWHTVLLTVVQRKPQISEDSMIVD